MNRNRFILGALLCSFLGINVVSSLIAADFPTGSPSFGTSYDTALAESKKTGKPMVVVFSATWCGPCQKMKKDVYPSAEVKAYHDKFIWAYLDTDEKANEKVAGQFKVEGIPHIEFINSEGKSVGNQVGSSAPAAFAKKLEGALKAATKK